MIPPPPCRLELVLGGARSGKSRYAEACAATAEADGLDIVYIATAEARDAEMSARIIHHQSRRPSRWALEESPIALADTLRRRAAPGSLLLVDCLTLWLSNLICHPNASAEAPHFVSERASFLAALAEIPGRTVVVSNEVGLGIVPLGELSRRFCDEQGRLNQDVAAIADRVTLVAAGLPLALKGG